MTPEPAPDGGPQATDLTPEALAKLREVEDLSAEILELERRLGIDPTHKRNDDTTDGLYQRRLRLYAELRKLKVLYPAIAKAAGTSDQSVRAAMHKWRAKRDAQGR